MIKCLWAQLENKSLVLILRVLLVRLRASERQRCRDGDTCTLSFTASVFLACCEPAASDGPDTESNLTSCLNCQDSFAQPLSVAGDESLKTSGLNKAPSYICLVSRRSCSFSGLHSFVLRSPIVLERLGTVFSIPRQLERVTGCSAIGPTGGEEADGSILTSPPSAWQPCQGASGEGFTRTRGTKCTYRCIHWTPVHVQSCICVCVWGV